MLDFVRTQGINCGVVNVYIERVTQCVKMADSCIVNIGCSASALEQHFTLYFEPQCIS
jgi:phage tail sheath protein FI